MADFEDIQKQTTAQMAQRLQRDETSDVAKDLARATQNLNAAHQQQMQQMQMQMQQQQQIIQALQQSSMAQRQAAASSMASSGGYSSPPPMATPFVSSYVQPVVNAGAQLAAVGGNYARNRAEDFRQSVVNTAQLYGNGAGQMGLQVSGAPGSISTNNLGFMPSLYHGMGISWEPNAAQGYNFGAYQRSQARNMGRSAQGYTQGTMGMVAGMASSEGLLDMGINAALMGMGPVGQMAAMFGAGNMITDALSPVTRTLDAVNPLAFGMAEMSRANMFGANASMGSHTFLRGSGQGRSFGTMSMGQEASIGSAMSDMALKDLTYANDDITQLQQSFAQTGQFLGVQGARQYSERMRKLMETHKTVMKTLQVSTEDAVSLMDTMYSTIGVDHGADMTRMTTKMYASAHLAGIDPMQMAQVASQGAQMAGQYGLLGSTGARLMMQSRALAGMGATSTVSTPLLASVGGEEGLARLIGSRNMQFMQGAGGAMMILNNGQIGTNVTGALGTATGNLRGQGDLVRILANRHTLSDKFSAEDIQGQQMQMYYGIAQQMGGAGSIRDKMILAMGGGPEAEAMVDSMRALPTTMTRQMQGRNAAVNDVIRDQLQEQRSISGRIRLFSRELVGDTLGGKAVRDGALGISSRIGMATEGYFGRAMDSLNGVTGTSQYTLEGAQGIMQDIESGRGPYSGGQTSSRSQSIRSDVRFALGESRGGFFSSDASLIKSQISGSVGNLSSSSAVDVNRLKRTLKAIRSGNVRENIYNKHVDISDISNQDVMDMVDEVGVGTKDREKIAASLGMNLIDESQINKKFMSQEERAKYSRKIFGVDGLLSNGEISDAEMDKVASSKMFQTFTDAIERLWSSYDPSKDRSGQGKEYKKAESEVLALYKSLESGDPKVKQVVDKMLKSKGIGIDVSSNSVDMKTLASSKIKEAGGNENFREYQSEFINKNKGTVFGKGRQKLFSAVERNKKLDQQADAAEIAMRGLVSGFNIDLTGDDLQGGITSSISMLSKIDDEKVKEMMKSSNVHERTIGAAAMKLKRGGSLTDEQSTITGNSIIALGLSGTVGEVIGGAGELDPTFMGAKMTEIQKAASDNQLQTAKILQKISEELGK